MMHSYATTCRFPFLLVTVLVLCLSSRTVSAHGFVHQVTIDGKVYTGNPPEPDGPNNPSIIRAIDDQSPVKGASNKFLNCGQDAQAAKLVASVNPGSELWFDWRTADLGSWPHNTGPLLFYMTNCGSVTCDQYDPTNARWFKINQQGRQKPGGDWVQQLIMNGAPANVTIPSNIAPGNYIIRHEIIALHLAQDVGGAEFYPSCTQVKIGGSGTGTPQDSELVLLPGAYSDTDPGIYDPQVYDDNAPYTFPGPPVAQFVQNPGNGGSTSDSGNSTSSSGSSSGSGSDSGSGDDGDSSSSTTPKGTTHPSTSSSSALGHKSSSTSTSDPNSNSNSSSSSDGSNSNGTNTTLSVQQQICRLQKSSSLDAALLVERRQSDAEWISSLKNEKVRRGLGWHAKNAWKGFLVGTRAAGTNQKQSPGAMGAKRPRSGSR